MYSCAVEDRASRAKMSNHTLSKYFDKHIMVSRMWDDSVHAADIVVKTILVTVLKCDLLVFIYMYLNCIIVQL